MWTDWIAYLAFPLVACLCTAIWWVPCVWFATSKLPASQDHWTERARVKYEIGVGVVLAMVLIAILVGGATALVHGVGNDSVRVATITVVILWIVLRKLSRVILLRRGWRPATGQSRHQLMMYGHVLCVFLAAAVMPYTLSWISFGITIAVIVAIVWFFRHTTLVSTWTGLLHPAPDEVTEVVKSVADTFEVPTPDVLVERVWFANAFAVFGAYQMVFTENAVKILSRDELRSIAAHELGHLLETKKTRIRRYVGLIAIFPLLFVKPLIHISLFALLGALIVTLIVVTLFRAKPDKLEEEADAFAMKLDLPEETYAYALEKLYEFNLAPAALASKRKTHPDLYDRMIAAGVTPEWPRPRPAKPRRRIALIVIPILASFVFTVFAVSEVLPVDVQLALIGDETDHIDAAWKATGEGDNDRARRLAGRVLENSRRAFYREQAMLSLAGIDGCEQFPRWEEEITDSSIRTSMQFICSGTSESPTPDG